MIRHIVNSSDEIDDGSDPPHVDEDDESVSPARQDAQESAGDRTRRMDGARQPISETVRFRQGEREIQGWALNVSRGGLRAALEEPVSSGEEFEITLGEGEPRPGRVVWVRNQKDGSIVGVAFSDAEGSVPPPPVSEEE